MDNINLEDLDNASLEKLLSILQGLDDALKQEEEEMQNDWNGRKG